MNTIKIEHAHRAIEVLDIGLTGDLRDAYCDGAGAALEAALHDGIGREWISVEPFPDTFDDVEAWGYRCPENESEAENEMPMNFPNYPKLREIQELPMPFNNSITGAVSEWVETRSASGLIISARWEFRRRSGMPYRWQVGPGRVSLWLRDVIGWRAIDDLPEVEL